MKIKQIFPYDRESRFIVLTEDDHIFDIWQNEETAKWYAHEIKGIKEAIEEDQLIHTSP